MSARYAFTCFGMPGPCGTRPVHANSTEGCCGDADLTVAAVSGCGSVQGATYQWAFSAEVWTRWTCGQASLEVGAPLPPSLPHDYNGFRFCVSDVKNENKNYRHILLSPLFLGIVSSSADAFSSKNVIHGEDGAEFSKFNWFYSSFFVICFIAIHFFVIHGEDEFHLM